MSSSPRHRAAQVLTACYDGQRIGQAMLDELQAAKPLAPADAGLCAELVLGVQRHRITCEHLAAHFYRGRWESLRPSLRVILALGVYQLCWLDRIPAHAAVDESVRLAKTHGRGALATANAVLRKIAEICGTVLESPPPAEMHRRWLQIDEVRGRLFEEDVFPDRTRRPLDYLVAATGHPMFLVEHWHRRFKPQRCLQICLAGMLRPKLILRANSRRITPQALLQRLQSTDSSAEFVKGTQAIALRDSPPIVQLPEFLEGLCQPQDSTAQIPVQMAAPKSSEIVLDLCAGVGTKSTQAAEIMNDEGVVIASDTDSAKLARIEESAHRLGLASLRICPAESLAADLGEIPRKPDVILVDAPCSNTGVLARRPDARYRASQKAINSLVALQREILNHAASIAGPSTRIVYSTCSIEQEENEEQAAWFIAQRPEWRIANECLTLPDVERNGGYAVSFLPSKKAPLF